MSLVREIVYQELGRSPFLHHRHTDRDTLEIIQVLSGGGNVLIKDRTYPLIDGMLLFIDAAYIHSINPQDESAYCRNKLIVEKDKLTRALKAADAEDLLLLFSDQPVFRPSAQEQIDKINQLFRAAASTSPNEGGQLLSTLLRLFLAAMPKKRAVTEDTDSRINWVLHYLHTHFAEQISVDTLAQNAHLNKFYLCHLFRVQTGMTIMQYLKEQRLTSARQWLVETDRSVMEIAQDCGFGSVSHFCTFFRNREGVSPREYRLSHRA